jgi:hypothetical protein
MSEIPSTASAPLTSVPPRTPDTANGVSVLLAASALGLALVAMWIINSTYERYRDRTDLEMPQWFSINMDLTLKVLPLGGVAGLCLLVSAGLFLSWVGRAGWAMRTGFMVQWLMSAVLIGWVFLSRLP